MDLFETNERVWGKRFDSNSVIKYYCHWIFRWYNFQLIGLVKDIDMSDLECDKIIMLQKKYFWLWLAINICILSFIPWFFWNETFVNSILTYFLAFVYSSNKAFLINSVTHSWGWKAYDTTIEPTFTLFATYLTLGEGYHNFHHAFPYDYSASELKWTENFNPGTFLIDMIEFFGWVHNKRVANPELIQKRRLRTGDTTAPVKPKWGVVLDYCLGFFVYFSPISLILAIRYVFTSSCYIFI